MVRTNLTAAQMAVDPPLMTVDDNGLRGVKTFPGAVVFGGLDANDKMVEPLLLGGVGAINLGLALEEQRRDSIRDAFHLGLLRDASLQANATATEFLGRQEERLRLLAPNLGRIEAELLSPLIRRVAGILNRAGLRPDARRFACSFSVPLAQAQRAAEAHRLTRNVRALQPFAELVPTALDQLDTQRLTKDMLSLAGLPRLGETGSGSSMSTRKTQWLANCWPDPLRQEVARAYEQLSETAEFRLILEDLARYAGLRTTSFVPGQSDQTAFNEGQRDLVFHLLEMVSSTFASSQRSRLRPKRTTAFNTKRTG